MWKAANQMRRRALRQPHGCGVNAVQDAFAPVGQCVALYDPPLILNEWSKDKLTAVTGTNLSLNLDYTCPEW